MHNHLLKHLTQTVKHTVNAAQSFYQSPHGQKLIKDVRNADKVRKFVTAIVKEL